jgi:septum formation protein
MTLILASTSTYRRLLLQRLGLEFTVQAPAVDESAQPGESAHTLVQRLAVEKACAVALNNPSAVVIGADQLACLDEQVLGKPGTIANAQRQLAACSAQRVEFLTAVSVCCGAQRCVTVVDRTSVQFRELSQQAIRTYVAREQPLDCAGAFKAEGLGIALFSSIHSDDPTALIGLPLIKLCTLLQQFGIDPLAAGAADAG